MTDLPAELTAIIQDQNATLAKAIRRAYNIGRLAGQSEGEASLRKELEGVLGRKSSPNHNNNQQPNVPPIVKLSAQTINQPVGKSRAPKGSVRPAIIAALIDNATHGVLFDEVLRRVHNAGHTMIKAETIRSTLSRLALEGIVKKDSQGWIVGKINEGSGTEVQEPS